MDNSFQWLFKSSFCVSLMMTTNARFNQILQENVIFFNCLYSIYFFGLYNINVEKHIFCHLKYLIPNDCTSRRRSLSVLAALFPFTVSPACSIGEVSVVKWEGHSHSCKEYPYLIWCYLTLTQGGMSSYQLAIMVTNPL